MSVVGGQNKFIFCEGEWDPDKPKSLDERLLNRLLHGRPPTTTIKPFGGKYQMRAFIVGRIVAEKKPTPNYLAFRDRDFDAEPSPDARLIPFRSGEPIYLSHRAAIENYLIASAMIYRYWMEHASTPAWKHGKPPDEIDIRAWQDAAANELIHYEATRWALAKLKPADRWPEVRTTWTEGSGHLPASLNEAECLESAKGLVRNFNLETAGVSEENLVEKYKGFLAFFTDPAFFTQAAYLIWFHGKDLKKAMQRLRPNSISLDHFCNWSVENFDWTQHADLKELADKM